MALDSCIARLPFVTILGSAFLYPRTITSSGTVKMSIKSYYHIGRIRSHAHCTYHLTRGMWNDCHICLVPFVGINRTDHMSDNVRTTRQTVFFRMNSQNRTNMLRADHLQAVYANSSRHLSLSCARDVLPDPLQLSVDTICLPQILLLRQHGINQRWNMCH